MIPHKIGKSMEILEGTTSSKIVVDTIALYNLLSNSYHILAQRKNDSYEIFEVKYFSFSVLSDLLEPMPCETIRN